jgi:hypothetical protein
MRGKGVAVHPAMCREAADPDCVEPSEQSSPSSRQEKGSRVNRRIFPPAAAAAAAAAQKLHKALRNAVLKQCAASQTIRLQTS